jgi:hypothetical protein
MVVALADLFLIFNKLFNGYSSFKTKGCQHGMVSISLASVLFVLASVAAQSTGLSLA